MKTSKEKETSNQKRGGSRSLNDRLTELNALNKHGNEINEHLSAELDKFSSAIASCAKVYSKAADTNQKQFAMLRKTIKEKLKFDWATGEYFPARGESGRECFHIRVRQVSEVIVAIDADSPSEAAKEAIAKVTEHPSLLFGKPLTAENVSQAE